MILGTKPDTIYFSKYSKLNQKKLSTIKIYRFLMFSEMLNLNKNLNVCTLKNSSRRNMPSKVTSKGCTMHKQTVFLTPELCPVCMAHQSRGCSQLRRNWSLPNNKLIVLWVIAQYQRLVGDSESTHGCSSVFFFILSL